MKQATLYAQLFRMFKKYSDDIVRITIWGLDDGTSWRTDGSPLLFEMNGTAKYAYYAVLDPEGYLAGDYLDVRKAPVEEPVEEPAETPEPDTSTPPQESPASETPPPATSGENTVPDPADGDNMMTPIIIVGVAVLVLGGIASGVYVYKKRK